MANSPKRHFSLRGCQATLLAAILCTAPLPALAGEQSPAPALRTEIANRAGSDLREFYRPRAGRPLWQGEDGTLSPAAFALLDLVESAELDGLDPRKLKARALASALRKVEDGPTAKNLGQAEMTLSRTLVAYVKAMRQLRRTLMTYASADLAPVVPTSGAVLQAAAGAPSLEKSIAGVGWMHPLYGQLRRVVATGSADPEQRAVIVANLERLRAIPANPASRYVLIDAAGARLWMYENGRVVDSMKVVVGKADNQTPLIAGHLRNAILNPYWNVPVDLARARIATNVLDKGIGYLKAGGYQVMSDWTDNARPIDPSTVDWHAVARGTQEVRVRQLPGSDNFMGKVKFEFPNDLGIYLHDTPDKDLMHKDERQASSGCVRLEDAPRLGRWLLRKPLPRRVTEVERRVNLPEAVPVYITYLTAMPANDKITFNPDPYGRDGATLALAGERNRSR
jgi:murein L,D-transpeptidase YcbB/YkuD